MVQNRHLAIFLKNTLISCLPIGSNFLPRNVATRHGTPPLCTWLIESEAAMHETKRNGETGRRPARGPGSAVSRSQRGPNPRPPSGPNGSLY
ncbi:hypothetical protein EYF80_024136 [Liparis tanakae]|uniref:Uncharacterized protein n=1 Tax=Liparis tanakae TaxID=230148 RepID=A0A4Z2HIK7_9TELE|nr:hypothetical protein EYF80_024136 [Liparis tanakae]